MFDKNLQDLVRGIRNHKDDEVKRPYNCRCLWRDIREGFWIKANVAVTVITVESAANVKS